MLKVIVAGSRDFSDYEMLKSKLDYYFSNTDPKNIEIVSGCARGADSLAIRYAEERGFSLKRFPADWNKHGKSAGMKRNAEMADYADGLVAFWDEQSKGTANMIDLATRKKLIVKIVRFNKERADNG